MSDTKRKKCERCASMARKGERFCEDCADIVLQELAEAGYLTPKPRARFRPLEAQEDRYATKFGVDDDTDDRRGDEF